MKYYLSSFKLGNQEEVEKLKKLIPKNKKTAYIANALDFAEGQTWQKEFTEFDVQQLADLGLEVERFDLRKYFNNQQQLEKDINKYGVIWVSGGNVFVLRQAFKLSGFEVIIKKLSLKNELLYGGYSAGICILASSLKGLELVDEPTKQVYSQATKAIWEGLGLVNYMLVPHYKSNHPESKLIDKVVEYYQKNKIPYKTLRDGEVLILNT